MRQACSSPQLSIASLAIATIRLGQLPRLNRILALKDLGFSLEQIGQVLADDLTVEQLRGMLKLKRAEAEQRLAAEQERLTRIETRLIE